MTVVPSGVAACQARIAAIQSQFFGTGGAPQPGTIAADGSTGTATWNYQPEDLQNLAAANGTGSSSSGTAAALAGGAAGYSLGGATGAGSTAAITGALATTSGVTGSAVVDSAKKYLGVPYVWGGTTAAGLDCSGLVQKAYGDLGIKLPRVAADQARMGTPVASLAQAKPGDLLAFGNPVDHIAIYVGNNQMIAAPKPGDKVKIQSVYTTPTAIRRIVADNPVSAVATAAYTSSSAAPAGSALAQAPAQYRAMFQAAAAKYGVPATLLAAVAKQESGFNANAVSPVGALGLMQLMPATAAGLGVNPRDPAQAIDGAARMLRDNLKTFGSTSLALAAYNAGAGAVQRYGGIPPYAETRDYVRRITADPGVTA